MSTPKSRPTTLQLECRPFVALGFRVQKGRSEFWARVSRLLVHKKARERLSREQRNLEPHAVSSLDTQRSKFSHSTSQPVRCEVGFILLFLVSVYKVPFYITVFGGTRNIYPTPCSLGCRVPETAYDFDQILLWVVGLGRVYVSGAGMCIG